MWYLKFKYKHSDCIYAPKFQELNLNCNFYYLGEYTEGNYIFTSAMIQLIGEEKNVKKFTKYLKNHKKIVSIEVYNNVLMILAKHKKDLILYETAYSPILIYVAPAYLSKDGFEIMEVASWSRKPLQDLINVLEKNKTTTYFEILQFHEKKLDDIYVAKILPKLPKKQKEAIQLAFQSGYYNFPRKTDLNKLSKIAKVAKQTFRENLRKAEAKLIPKIISE